jgi:hypothetical protein
LFTKEFDTTFIEDKPIGKGHYIAWNGETFDIEGITSKIHGYGIRWRYGLPSIGYWDQDYNNEFYQGLPKKTVLYHLDTTFAKFKRCNELSPTEIVFLGAGLGSVEYLDIDPMTGLSNHHTSKELVLKSNVIRGFINNTNHNIYIKAYRPLHLKTTNEVQYSDEGYVIRPGERIAANYRILPADDGIHTGDYFGQEFVFLGEYKDR